MTTKQATGVALKFFALYLLFNVLMVIPALIGLGYSINGSVGGPPSVLIRFGLPMIGICIGLVAIGLLWKTANSIIAKAAAHEEPVVNDLNTGSIMKIVFSCIGLYLTIEGLLSGLQVYVSACSYARDPSADLHLDVYLFIVPAVQFVLGCWLIAKPRQWVKAIRSIGEK